MSDIKLSVIIPVYNVEEYLEECVNSIIHQKLKEIEIILVDDGSTDSSGLMCDKFKEIDNRVKVIHKKNGRQGSARNAGLNIAAGEYTIFVDSDDYLDDSLKDLYEISKNNDLDILFFTAKTIKDPGFIGDTVNYDMYHTHLYEVISGEQYLLDDEYITQPCMRLYKSSFLKNLGVSYLENCIHEDEGFSFICSLYASRCMKIKKAYYNRRYRQESTMTSLKAINSAYGYACTLMQLVDWYEKEDDLVKKRLIKQKYYSCYYMLMNSNYSLCWIPFETYRMLRRGKSIIGHYKSLKHEFLSSFPFLSLYLFKLKKLFKK